MGCFIEHIVTDSAVEAQVKELIPDAGLRRRMSRVVKSAVATAVECAGGIDGTGAVDAIITATGLGCLADSERFLRNMIADSEQLLNPTPFIQSTFNTVGGQIALLRHNRCYNVTYVHRDHGFEDALLDAWMRLADAESRSVLVGAFEERTPAQYRIMERMGCWRKGACAEGTVFALLTAEPSEQSLAEWAHWELLSCRITEEECLNRYATEENAVLLTGGEGRWGYSPVASARLFAEAVERIARGAKEVIVYNGHGDGRPTIAVLRCIGC